MQARLRLDIEHKSAIEGTLENAILRGIQLGWLHRYSRALVGLADAVRRSGEFDLYEVY